MPSFNLVEQAWIPCLMIGSGEPRELSLQDTLTCAYEVREIFDNSPLVTVALHRLLLAILHRNFGPRSFNEWKELWRRGKWDSDVIIQYLQTWQHRFELFDETRPFYQSPRLQKAGKEKKRSQTAAQETVEDVDLHPVALLAHEAATGNNATLFDHSFKELPEPYSPVTAARYLLARQAFSIGFGKSSPFYFQDSTLVRGSTVLALGNNLFETLVLNLLPYSEQRPITQQGNDLPIWEQETPEQPDENGTVAKGYLDYLTWQSRRIHLIPEGDPPVVRYCQMQQNLRLADEPEIHDPFKCYRKDEKLGWQPLPLNPTKALWRDSHTLFQESNGSHKRLEVFNHLARINTARRHGEIEAKPKYAFAVYGFATEIGKAASVILWSRERLPLPLAYLNEPKLVDVLEQALKLAQEIAEPLRKGIRLLAKLLLAPLSDAPQSRQPDEKDVSRLTASFGADRVYWSRLEANFKRLLVDLPEEYREIEDTTQPSYQALTLWARQLDATARDAFTIVINSLSGSARDLKAAAEAERYFNLLMSQTRKSYSYLFPIK
ncbi:MAG: type I-E CRISPR-associated protein Cse1/CasA [Pyrinomonadaceae bacterium]